MPLKQEAIGFGAAPLPVVAPLTLFFAITASGWRDVGEWAEVILISYGLTLVIGVPVHLALKRLGRSSLPAYLGATGLCVAAIVGALALLQILLPLPQVENPHSIRNAGVGGWAALTLVFEGFALLGAWIFWRVSVRRKRPAVRPEAIAL